MEESMIYVYIPSNGLPVVSQMETPPERPSRLLEVYELWRERECSAAEVLRAIAIEYLHLCLQAHESICSGAADQSDPQVSATYRLAYRTAAKLVCDDAKSDRSDVLNLDGRKFHFVSENIMGFSEEAIARVLGQGRTSEIAQIMQRIRSLWAENQVELRRKVAVIGTESGA
jgi:hypothetical protein